MTMKKKLAEYGGFLDVGLLSHGFAPHMRDYDIVFEALWGKKEWADAKGTYRLRFSHCPEATTMTAVPDMGWTKVWSDVFIDYSEWLAAGEPEGFVWGACWSTAYPGLSYIEELIACESLVRALGLSMHEVSIATEAFHIRIVFHDFTVTKLDDMVRVSDKVIFPLKCRTTMTKLANNRFKADGPPLAARRLNPGGGQADGLHPCESPGSANSENQDGGFRSDDRCQAAQRGTCPSHVSCCTKDVHAAHDHDDARTGHGPWATCCTRTRRVPDVRAPFGKAHVFYPEAEATAAPRRCCWTSTRSGWCGAEGPARRGAPSTSTSTTGPTRPRRS